MTPSRAHPSQASSSTRNHISVLWAADQIAAISGKEYRSIMLIFSSMFFSAVCYVLWLVYHMRKAVKANAQAVSPPFNSATLDTTSYNSFRLQKCTQTNHISTIQVFQGEKAAVRDPPLSRGQACGETRRPRSDQSRPPVPTRLTGSVESECIGTSGCFPSPDRFGIALNRTREQAGL